ncbi:MAG: alpha/beta hydrolase [Thermoleophilia bacterium]
MPVDPAVRAYLDGLAAAGIVPVNEVPIADSRRLADQLAPRLFGDPDPVGSIDDWTVPGPGGPISIRRYLPVGADGPLPALVWYHGGGWVVGSLDSHDLACRALANRAGCAVVAVDYRLAPEHRFPAAVDDCWAATVWVAEHAGELGVDRARLAVGGDSAGGNLAAVMALRARDRGLPLRLQLLVYPVADCSFDTPSYEENAVGFGLTRDAMRWYWEQYLGPDGDGAHPEASPLRAELAGVCPAHVQVVELDPLRDEGALLAAALDRAGVETTLARFDGLIHGVVRMPGVIPRANEVLDDASTALRRALA